ncbi:hypothetical protein K438DRAFT_1932369 [Mycena galopus ATCC 62051]|nr:hypothetical protein K438DRAFT_1932369 [Mycena galopus ATCC 62051]
MSRIQAKPTFLQREIFELVVRSNNRDAALKLNLSLRRVDRVFFELVKISSPAQTDGAFISQAARILSACDRVQRLLLLVGDMRAFCSALHRQLPLRVRRLYMRLQDFAVTIISIPAPPVWLSGITHLGLGTGPNSSDLEILKKLPHLTHFALWAVNIEFSHVETVCARCPNLQILVMLGGNIRDAPPLDSRVVLECITVGPVRDWEDAHFGRPDIWTRAEGVVAERRRSAAQRRIDETE